MSARITDFGMARSGPAGDESHVSTRIMGTLGYLDPSYMVTGDTSRASHVGVCWAERVAECGSWHKHLANVTTSLVH